MNLRCPRCGYTSELDGFDVLGADDGYLFCIQCHLHHPMVEVPEEELPCLDSAPTDPER